MCGLGFNSLPGCIGFHGKPLPPNGPCGKCRYGELCQYVNSNFVAKSELKKLQQLVADLKAVLTGGA